MTTGHLAAPAAPAEPVRSPQPATRSPRPTGVRYGALVIGLGVLGLVIVLATRPPATSGEADSPLLGQPAPNISGPGLAGGRVDLTDLRGRFVLVNFFASWCEPCHVEQPSLVKLSRSVSVLGVVYDDSSSNALAFLRAGGARWPAVADPNGAVSVRYGVRGPPESYLVSPDGTVVAKIVGEVTPTQIGYLHSVMARVLRTGQ